MFKIFFKVLFTIITTVLNIILLPINALVANLFPDLSSLVTNFTTLVNRVFGSGMAYFASILPPTTKQLILIYLGILVSFYTVSISVHAIVKIFTIVKKIKFW